MFRHSAKSCPIVVQAGLGSDVIADQSRLLVVRIEPWLRANTTENTAINRVDQAAMATFDGVFSSLFLGVTVNADLPIIAR